MRTLLAILFSVITLGAQAPEPIKAEDKVKVQSITIQILRIENSFRLLQEEHKKLQAQKVKWNKDMLVKYEVNGYKLNAELKWVKKEKADAITSTNTSP